MNSVSTLFHRAEEYLTYRRSLGFELKIEGAELLRFARYADSHGARGYVTTRLAVRWAKQSKGADPLYWARRLDIVRRFAKYEVLFDSRTETPPEGLLGPSYRRPTPHIYPAHEIQALLATAAKLGPIGGLRPCTYVTLLGLLASTGLRISEALALMREDVDLNTGVLLIRLGKFKKSRLVPVHVSTVEQLRAYEQRRDRRVPHPRSNTFFVTEHGTSLKYHRTYMTFRRLREALGWSANEQGYLRRIHDLRHTFVVRRLLRWYQEGADLDRKIVALATYLGHVKVTDTYWYLSAIPELMAVVGNRFEQFAHQELENTHEK